MVEENKAPQSLIYIEKSKNIEGYGVFARNNIKKNTLIESCPLILVPIKDFYHIKQTKLNFYYFEYNSKFIAMALGYGSLYNHSYRPNAKYVFNYKKKLIRIYSLRVIKADEEILINYNYDPEDKTSLKKWYDPNLKVVR